MDERIIENLVGYAFKKAKKECASHSKFALSKHISLDIPLSSKTLERLYDNYINKLKKYGKPNAESIKLLCIYVGYKDFKEFINHHLLVENSIIEVDSDTSTPKFSRFTPLNYALLFAFLILLSLKWFLPANTLSMGFINKNKHLTWANHDDEESPYAKTLQSKYATPMSTPDIKMIPSTRDIAVTKVYPLFTDNTHIPRIWYHKNENGEIEYYLTPKLQSIHKSLLKKGTAPVNTQNVTGHIDREASHASE